MNRKPTDVRLLLRERRGAVYTEALIAIPVLLFFFSASLQLAYLSIASLLLRHAAVAAARSAAVIVPDAPSAFGDGSAAGTPSGGPIAAVPKAAAAGLAAAHDTPLPLPA